MRAIRATNVVHCILMLALTTPAAMPAEDDIAALEARNVQLDAEIKRLEELKAKLQAEEAKLAEEEARIKAELGMATPEPGKPDEGARVVRVSADELAVACQNSYRESARAGGHMSTWDERANQQWCKCVVSNLQAVLTPEERAHFLRDATGFIRAATADAPPNGQRNWRLFTPVTNCWN